MRISGPEVSRSSLCTAGGGGGGGGGSESFPTFDRANGDSESEISVWTTVTSAVMELCDRKFMVGINLKCTINKP